VTNPTKPFEPTLALVERRIAALYQTRQHNPDAPLWVLFSDAELRAMSGPEEKP
jgi:hypothetical protein